MHIDDMPNRFVAVAAGGKVFRSDSLVLLWRMLPPGTYILKDDGRAQAVYMRKELAAPESQSHIQVLWQPDDYLWLYLRRMNPGTYLVQDDPGQPAYVLEKLPVAWELILLRRHASWLKGEELSPETEQMLEVQLVALAAQLRLTTAGKEYPERRG